MLRTWGLALAILQLTDLGLNPTNSTNCHVILGKCLDLSGLLLLHLEMGFVTVLASEGGDEHSGSRMYETI